MKKGAELAFPLALEGPQPARPDLDIISKERTKHTVSQHWMKSDALAFKLS